MPIFNCALQMITQQKTLTTNLFSLSLPPTATFTYKPDRHAPITAHHLHYQSHNSSNYQSQHRPGHHYIHLNFQQLLDSEDNFRSPCWNISHHQHSFAGLLSPRKSNSTEVTMLLLGSNQFLYYCKLLSCKYYSKFL